MPCSSMARRREMAAARSTRKKTCGRTTLGSTAFVGLSSIRLTPVTKRDRVEWDEEQEQAAVAAVERQRAVPVPDELKGTIHDSAAKHWDKFYSENQSRFFNDRAWLQTEFDELAEAVKPDAGPRRIIEIGSGPGNTLYPLLKANENPHLRLHAFDYSREAISLVRVSVLLTSTQHCAKLTNASSRTLHSILRALMRRSGT